MGEHFLKGEIEVSNSEDTFWSRYASRRLVELRGAEHRTRLATRAMPGLLFVHVWRKTPTPAAVSSDLAQQSQSTFEKTVSRVVFDASPGQLWNGFNTFVTSLRREFDCTIYWFPSLDTGSSPQYPPPFSLVAPLALSSTFQFPVSGKLSLVALRDAVASSPLYPRSKGEDTISH